MKKILLLLLIMHLSIRAMGQDVQYVDASELTLIGRLDSATNPYHRVEVSKYPKLTKPERTLLRQPAGMAVVFSTNSPLITVRTKYSTLYKGFNSTMIAGAGYDLYIRKDGEWLYAGSQAHKNEGTPLTLVKDMDPSTKECLLYLPLFSELAQVEIGTAPGSETKPAENPFRHRIVVFGSSFTHGSGTSRAGMSYPSQLERNTGLYFINLGVSGNSKLQPVFADILADSHAEAFVIDGFSNPKPEEIEARLLPFVASIRAVCPETPIIFVKTAYREACNFDLAKQAYFSDQIARAARMVERAKDQYDHVYFLDLDKLTGDDHITSTDGTHPSDLGYWRWAGNLQRPLLKILARYGIK